MLALLAGCLEPALVLLGILAAFASDVVAPSLPAIALEYGVPVAHAQSVITVFLLALGFAYPLVGACADTCGRVRTLAIGLVLFVAASAIAALPTSLRLLLALRVAQAVGGAASLVAAQAMIGDRFEGDAPARERVLSRVVAARTLAVLGAPSIGSLALALCGWRSVFALLAVTGTLAAAVFAAVFAGDAGERARPASAHGGADDGATDLPAYDALDGVDERPGVLRTLGVLTGDLPYMAHLCADACSCAAAWLFIAASPDVVLGYFGRGVFTYGGYMAVYAGAGVVGSFRAPEIARALKRGCALAGVSPRRPALSAALALLAAAPLLAAAAAAALVAAAHGPSQPVAWLGYVGAMLAVPIARSVAIVQCLDFSLGRFDGRLRATAMGLHFSARAIVSAAAIAAHGQAASGACEACALPPPPLLLSLFMAVPPAGALAVVLHVDGGMNTRHDVHVDHQNADVIDDAS